MVNGTPPPPLTKRRERVLAIVNEVAGATYPDARYKAFSPGYQPESETWRERIKSAGADPDHYTECGRLPGYVLEQLHATGGGSRSGLESLRTYGRGQGAWVEPGEGRRPRRGDLYGVADTRGGILTHVGVIDDATGNSEWTTWDGGQSVPPVQSIEHRTRTWNERTNQLGPPKGINRPAKYLVGWLDIDRISLGDEPRNA